MRTDDGIPETSDIRDLFTLLPQALAEITARRKDPALRAKVLEYLGGDIPWYFDREEPVLYLARHLATPNYEAIRFIEISRLYNLPTIIGEDTGGIFVSINELKRALGRLPIVKSIARNKDEIIENFTTIDFNQSQGKPFSKIITYTGEPLVALHHRLFSTMYSTPPTIVDEARWIDRNFRHDLLEQYKRMFTLLIMHGIMFESYPPNESELVHQYVIPAFTAVKEMFGCRPLVYDLIPDEIEYERNWNAYPPNLYPIIAKDFS